MLLILAVSAAAVFQLMEDDTIPPGIGLILLVLIAGIFAAQLHY